MKELKLHFGLPGFSINSMYYATRKTKTTEARRWSCAINYHVRDQAADIAEFRQSFDPLKHVFHVEIQYFMKNFYSKEGRVSNKTFDLSNIEKPLIDLVFIPSNHGEVPYQSPNLNIDDRYITRLVSEKLPGLEDEIIFKIQIHPKPELQPSPQECDQDE